MAAGTWLCPHCYEEDHPHEGWMCNSSICMKRRGFKPTGIAIYDAQQRGFKSVGHWLQAQIKKRGVDALTTDADEDAVGASTSGSAPAATAAAAAAPPPRRATRRSGGGGSAAALETVVEEESCHGSCGHQGADADASDAPARRRSGGGDQDGGKRRTRGAGAAAAVTMAAKKADQAVVSDVAAKGAKDVAAAKGGKRGAAAGKGGKGGKQSREGSSEPFAPPTPVKRSAEVAADGGAKRSLRARRV
jgi:hypothetical protein